MSEEYMKWIPVAEALLLQAYYRTLGMVSIHAGINDVYRALQELSTKRGGTLVWKLEGRVARWDDLDVFPGVKMSIYILGSQLRQKNTVYIRVGFWQSYLLAASKQGNT